MYGFTRWLGLGTFLLATAAVCAASDLTPEDVPLFRLRARVVSEGGQAPGEGPFLFQLEVGSASVSSRGREWSEWLEYNREMAAVTLKSYPAIYLRAYPIVLRLRVGQVKVPALVEAEMELAETKEVVRLQWELFGPTGGLLLWRGADRRPRAATMAEYNRRYWAVLQGHHLSSASRPRHLTVVDRFIGGDDDRLAWAEGIRWLGAMGINTMLVPPNPHLRPLLEAVGIHRIAWAVYNPPGYAFDYEDGTGPEDLRRWAQELARPYREAGYSEGSMAVFFMSDEPGWYYPAMFRALKKRPEALARFHDYLRAQGLRPEELGAKGWEELEPVGLSAATSAAGKRLFYWSMRFFPWDSARHFSRCTAALEEAFSPGLGVATNWNFFAGRFYNPGPIHHNPDKESPDAAMGGHDWLEFGHMRGCTLLWTEDWFADAQAYQWSYYGARLRSAASRAKLSFGGYVVPRVAGDRTDGIAQKVLALVGQGAKVVTYYVFGPEYNFPGNCYSENERVLGQIVEANRLLAFADDLLAAGSKPRSAVGLVMPRSAQVWDTDRLPLPSPIVDATNTNLNASTADYMAETFDLYLALQHANVPVEILSEDELSADGLQGLRVLYLTEPNVPVEGQRALLEWVRGGGTLVTVSGAASLDRYNEPTGLVADATGVVEGPRGRLPVADVRQLPWVAAGDGLAGPFQAAGVRGELRKWDGKVLGRFDDGAPAVVESEVEKGRRIHFAWLPGLSYFRSAGEIKDGLPAGFSESLRQWILYSVRTSQVELPVQASAPLVETPLLLSDKGAAMVLLNWSGEPIEKLTLKVRLPFPARSAASARQGPLTLRVADGQVELTLPLVAAVDVVAVRP
jgi:hypothetical protein